MSSEEKINNLRAKLSPAKQKLLEKRLQVAKDSNYPSDLPNPHEEIYVSHLKFSVSKDWVLDEHRIMGKATFPGTAYLEIAKKAGDQYFPNCEIEIKDVYFFMPLVVEDWEEKEVRTVLKKQEKGFEFVIMSQSNSDSWIEHARGKIACRELQPLIKHKLVEIQSKFNQQNLVITDTDFQSKIMEWGPRWSNCKWIKIGTNQGLAFLELPELFIDDLNSHNLHPALLDSATGFLTLKFKEDGSYLPFSYKSLKIKGNLPSKLYSYIKVIGNKQTQKETLTFNVTIMNDQGIELVEIEEYTLRQFKQQ